jgi:hypothetical protein
VTESRLELLEPTVGAPGGLFRGCGTVGPAGRRRRSALIGAAETVDLLPQASRVAAQPVNDVLELRIEVRGGLLNAPLARDLVALVRGPECRRASG